MSICILSFFRFLSRQQAHVLGDALIVPPLGLALLLEGDPVEPLSFWCCSFERTKPFLLFGRRPRLLGRRLVEPPAFLGDGKVHRLLQFRGQERLSFSQIIRLGGTWLRVSGAPSLSGLGEGHRTVCGGRLPVGK